MQGNHVFLDLETLDSTPTSAIIVIGAVAVRRGELGALESMQFKALIDHESAKQHGSVSASTVHWWGGQTAAARHDAFEAGPRLSLPVALGALCDFYASIPGGVAGVWGNGASFDNAILHHAFSKTGIKCPWEYWEDRDVRTVVALAEAKGLMYKANMPFVGTRHNAVDDAMHQAKYTMACLNALTGGA